MTEQCGFCSKRESLSQNALCGQQICIICGLLGVSTKITPTSTFLLIQAAVAVNGWRGAFVFLLIENAILNSVSSFGTAVGRADSNWLFAVVLCLHAKAFITATVVKWRLVYALYFTQFLSLFLLRFRTRKRNKCRYLRKSY